MQFAGRFTCGDDGCHDEDLEYLTTCEICEDGKREDEFDEEDRQSSIFTLADGSQRVAGDALIEEVNEVFQTQLPEDDFETIGGLVAHELGRVPRRGESVDVGGLRFVVMLARGGAVRWFKVTRAPEVAPAAEAG